MGLATLKTCDITIQYGNIYVPPCELSTRLKNGRLPPTPTYNVLPTN